MSDEIDHYISRRTALKGGAAVIAGGIAYGAYVRYQNRPTLSVELSPWTGGRIEVLEADDETLDDVVLRNDAEFIFETANLSETIQAADVWIEVTADFADGIEEIASGTVYSTIQNGIEIFNLADDMGMESNISLTTHSEISISDFEPDIGGIQSSPVQLLIGAEIQPDEPDAGLSNQSEYEFTITVDYTDVRE